MDAGSNWAGNIRFSARELHAPTSVGELRSIVAASRGLRALGSRHSFNSIADTTGDLVDVTALPRVFELDEDAQTVTVSAGTRYGEFAPILDAAGWALRNTGSLPHITAGGATATGTHGSGDRNGTLSSQVAAIEFVTADGGTERIGRGDEGFEGAVVHLGALGVATLLTLDVVPRFDARQDSYRGIDWDTVLERLDDITGVGYSVSLFTRWTGDDFGEILVKEVMGPGSEPRMPEELFGARPVPVRDTDPRAGVEVLVAEEDGASTRRGGVVGPWFERLPHFRLGFTPSNGDELQTEYLVPRPAALEAMTEVRRLASRIEPHLHVTEIRTIAADTLWLSGASETDAVAIHFTWKNHPAEVRGLLPAIEELLLPLGARPHWGKLFHTRELERLYPRMDDFRALADRVDPRGKLRNRWLDERLFR